MKKTIRILVVSFVALFLTTAVVYAAVTWSETQPGGNADYSWTPSAMSSDGQKMIVGDQGGTLYISSNRGSSWTLIDPSGIAESDWYTTSMSSDGQIVVAGVYIGRLYRSTDGGSNWSEIRPAGNLNHNWYTTSMSSNGQIMLAGINSGRLYKSTNGGDTWSETRPAGDTDISWNSSHMSSDGQVMLAGAAGRLYLSTNGGTSWSETRPAGDVDKTWLSIGMSSNGEVILVGAQGDRLYLSTNTGSTWSETQPAGDVGKIWYFNSVSSNGQTFLAGGEDRVYISTNGGSTWSQTQPAGDVDKNWVLGNMSADSQVFLAGVYDGRLYLGLNPLPTSTPTSSSGGGSSAPSTGPFSCTDSMPTGTPNLFQITTTKTTATLYFSPAANSNGYYIGYGNGQNTTDYGVQTNFGDVSGVLSYTINLLSPNTTYSFIIRGQNGCMPGNWGNTMTVKTTKSGSATYFNNVVSQALSFIPQSATILGTATTKNPITTPHATPIQKKVVVKPTPKITPAIEKKQCFLFICL